MLNKKWIFYLFVLFIWAIWISGVFGNNGLLQAYQLSRLKNELTLRIKALTNEKNRMQVTLHGLQTDSFIQEKVIRETLGYARKNELVFEIQ